MTKSRKFPLKTKRPKNISHASKSYMNQIGERFDKLGTYDE